MPPPDHLEYPEPGFPPPGYGFPGFPGFPPPGYGPAGFPGFPPPGYPPPGYAPPPGYGPAPGYPGYPPPGYGVFQPGIIPLRPLSLSDIFNGAVGYIRANPKATLGLTAAIVVIVQLIVLIITAGPLAAANRLPTAASGQLTGGDVAGWAASVGIGGLVSWLAGILLSGMLTVIVGRAVFGATISGGEAWTKVRRRLPALLGLAALEAAGALLVTGLVVLVIAAVATVGNYAAAFVFGFPLVLSVLAMLVYFYTILSFAPVLIVLERLPVVDAITRSFTLVRNSFWRVLGIRALTFVVVFVVAAAIGAPFNVVAQLIAAPSPGPLLFSLSVGAVGSAIGRIVTAPFSAGVVVLLYTDRRMRSEAFDLILQTGAAGGPAAAASTDNLWLTRPV